MKSKKGFTLIELLVVIAIIGILSSVVLASLNSARRKSRDARRLADLQQIKLASELYFDQNRQYPASTSLLAPTFIASVPIDPLNASYAYSASGTTSYCLGTTLEDPASIGTSSSNSVCDAANGGTENYWVAP
ncbi:MAG: type II secretion system protein [Patescibacteria group bacterium]